MKIGIVGDVHFCEYSSILRRRGNKFSLRLENCIKSVNWAEEITSKCDMVVYLGDFFDKSSLNAAEITACSDIVWNNVPHYFLTGNHEIGIHDSLFSSAHIFNRNNSHIINFSTKMFLDGCELCYLPYILVDEQQDSITDYFGDYSNRRIIFSHNDISGIQMGKFISKSGFEISDIELNCDLFINGHYHNESRTGNKIINVGNLTGQNFSEDAFEYNHKILILDTDTLNYNTYINPYAINFYKIYDVDKIDEVINGVVTVKVSEENIDNVKYKLENNKNILAYRVIVDYTKDIIDDSQLVVSVDHINEFKKFVLSRLGNSELINEELDIIHG